MAEHDGSTRAKTATNEHDETAAPQEDRGAPPQNGTAPQAPPEQVSSTGLSAQELEDRLRQAMADLANLRQRYARQLAAEQLAERDRVAAAWLPVVDNLERALEHAEADPSALVAGVRAVRDQAVGVLAALGYPRRDETGVPFDPMQHEAISIVRVPEVPAGTVVQVVRPGYGDGERQLRPAAVIVSAGPE